MGRSTAGGHQQSPDPADAGLPPPATRDLVIERDLPVPMADGAVLLADRWAPGAGGEALPTALLRTPYGRRGPFGVGMARPLAERGFQVLIQSRPGRAGGRAGRWARCRSARPTPPPSGTTPATSRTSSPTTAAPRAGPGSTTGTGWPG